MLLSFKYLIFMFLLSNLNQSYQYSFAVERYPGGLDDLEANDEQPFDWSEFHDEESPHLYDNYLSYIQNQINDRENDREQRNLNDDINSIINDEESLFKLIFEDFDDDSDDEKRGLLSKIFGKKKTTTTPAPTTTTTTPTTTTTTTTRLTTVTPMITTTRSTSYSPVEDKPSLVASNDAFYSVKKKCEEDQYSSLCVKTKVELYSLVSKCAGLKKNTAELKKTCDDVISLYCYIYANIDKSTCQSTSYEPYVPGKNTKSTSAPTVSTTQYSTRSTTTEKSYSSEADDPFYKLKKRCEEDPYGSTCKKTKAELSELVDKCEEVHIKTAKLKETCAEVISIYCYIFSKIDRITCLMTPHEPYVPGKTKPTISTQYPTFSTTTAPRITTTTATTTRSTTRQAITTYSTRTPTTSSQVTPSAGGGSASYPFDLIPGFQGTINAIPEDTSTLKQIGTFCAKSKAKDKNCDSLLLMLKEKFKSCEKKPASDTDCQSFKKKFCTAYPNFNCCAEVLAGRTCKGASVGRRSQELYDTLMRYLSYEEDSE